MVQPAPQAARGRLPLVGPARPRREHHALVGTRCNLGCGYCQRLPPAATGDAGAAEPGDVVVVGGGEPMLEPELLSRLRALPGPVVLETNGAMLHLPSNVRRLAAARVRGVRLFLPGWDAESTDRLARVEGLAALQAAAARNVLDAGLELELGVPVTAELAAELPRWLERVEELRGRGGDAPRVALAWLVPAGLAPTRELELALARFALGAIRRGVVAWLAGPAAPAPCAFRRPEAFASLFAGPRAPRARAEACGGCVLSDVCSGPVRGATAAAFEDGGRGPVAFDAATATLRNAAEVQAWVEAGEAQRWGRANFVSVGSEPDLRGGVALSALLRGLYHCNQRCTFCWVDLEQPRVPTAAVEQALAMTALEGMQVLSITGGEPTLDRRLPAQVRLARALGAREVTLQTNAVRLDDPARALALAQAGLTRAFVSLHGATAEVSDAITRAPGTFARTLRGIRNLLDAGISVGVGVVFTTENRAQARALVTLVATELRGVDLTLSVASPVNERVDVRAVTPRYSELAPTLREAVATARALGVPFAGLFGQCGLPPCILDGDPACFPELEREHPVWSSAEDFVHAPACEGCRLRPKCPGIRRAYAEVHGLEELHAL